MSAPASPPFSVVEDAAQVVLRIDAPRTVGVGQSFQLVGVIEESQVDRQSLRIAWGSITSGQRLLNGYAAADGDYCWGYEECREHSYDPQTKKTSTRTCGSFKGAYYMYQAKEMCAKQK